MQPAISSLFSRHTVLQETTVGINLGRQKKGRIKDDWPFAKVLTDTLFLGERIGHVAVPRIQKTSSRVRAGTDLLPVPAIAIKPLGFRSPQTGKGRRQNATSPSPLWGCSRPRSALLNLDRGACFFQLLLDLFGLVLRNTFFQGSRCTFHSSLGLFQAQTGNSANRLNDSHLAGTKTG